VSPPALHFSPFPPLLSPHLPLSVLFTLPAHRFLFLLSLRILVIPRRNEEPVFRRFQITFPPSLLFFSIVGPQPRGPTHPRMLTARLPSFSNPATSRRSLTSLPRDSVTILNYKRVSHFSFPPLTGSYLFSLSGSRFCPFLYASLISLLLKFKCRPLLLSRTQPFGVHSCNGRVHLQRQFKLPVLPPFPSSLQRF